MVSNNPRDLVESAHAEIRTARNMPAAADETTSYAAVNRAGNYDDVARRAYEIFLDRQRTGEEGTADDDWYRAEEEVGRSRYSESL
jgi:hypothetical protein